MTAISLGRKSGCVFPSSVSLQVPSEKRARHMHIVGHTGSGKTTLLSNIITQDMVNNAGFALIDPKGDLVDQLLGHVPVHRFDDVILFDPADTERPIGFNPMERTQRVPTSRTASDLVSTFKKLFAESWGPRLEHILRASVLTLLQLPGTTLLDIPDLLTDPKFRDAVLAHITDPILQNFWRSEYKEITKGREYIMTIEPILNKVGPWLAYPEIRNIVGQPTNSFDLRHIMDNRRILFVRLPEALGEDITGMLGALLVSRIQLAAVSRSDVAPSKRVPFYLYVDEFQNFFTSAFEKILTEARSYALSLIVANQYDEQLSHELRQAVWNNAAVRVHCRQEDGRFLASYQEPQNPAVDTLQFLPPPPLRKHDPGLARLVTQASTQRYGRPVTEVEDIILRRKRGRPDFDQEPPAYYD